MKKIKLDGVSYLYLGAFCVLLTMLALWCVDISVSALLAGGVVSNGFAVRNPMVTYHIGLYIVVLINFFMVMILFNNIWMAHKK